MRIGELADQAGVSTKAIRYYEQLGLVEPDRRANGYRDYTQYHLQVVTEICQLAECGITPSRAAPFIECLDTGHEQSDECPASLLAYRNAIAEIDRSTESLASRRALLVARLQKSASRTFRKEPTSMVDYSKVLPDNLPVPTDDGAAGHLPGRRMPQLTLHATDGSPVDLAELGVGRTIIYIYPLTGVPGVDLPQGWDDIPGARGCSTEACDFRDHFSDLRAAGAEHVFGMSSQDLDYQREVVNRLGLPFPMLSDEAFVLADELRLPTFAAPGHDRLYTRLTMVIRDGLIEHVFYPIFPPNTHAAQVLDWLRDNNDADR